ncbi:hypothetical protein HK405_014952, partial [Cladochytrium tenue]
DVFLVLPAEPHTTSPPATPPLHVFGLANADAVAPVAADAASPLLLLSRLDRLAVSPPRVPLASLGAANTATGPTRLPHELWLAIAHRAAPNDVARLRRVSRAVAAAASDPALWRRHCLAAGVDCDAVAAASASCPPSWSLVYARQHVLRRRLFRGGRCRARCINDAHALGVTAIDFVEPTVPRLSVTTEDSTPPQPPPRLLVTGSWDASLKLWRLVRDDPLTPRQNHSGGARLDARWSDAARYDDSDSDSPGSDNEDTADDVDAGAVAAAAWESATEDDDPAAAELGWWSAGPSAAAAAAAAAAAPESS